MRATTLASTSSDANLLEGAPGPAESSRAADLDIEEAIRHIGATEGIKLHGSTPPAEQVKVFLNQAAVRQVQEHSTSDLEAELGGVLLGHVRESDGYLLVAVFAALPVATDDRGPVHFTFTADAWSQLHRDKEHDYPDLDIVGWYHTHPGLGVFYSADDVVVHKAAFVLPWQIGLVVDPIGNEACLVCWERKVSKRGEAATLVGISGYYELFDEQRTSLARWRLIDSEIWPEYHDSPEEGRSKRQVLVAANDLPSLPDISPWWGLILGGISLLISLLLLLDRILAILAALG
jgi:proteasome lid subunit RPN8/RPN11